MLFYDFLYTDYKDVCKLLVYTSVPWGQNRTTLGIFDRFLTTPPVFGHARTDLWVEYRPIPRWTLKRSGA